VSSITVRDARRVAVIGERTDLAGGLGGLGDLIQTSFRAVRAPVTLRSEVNT
jgi:hypothetical protein